MGLAAVVRCAQSGGRKSADSGRSPDRDRTAGFDL